LVARDAASLGTVAADVAKLGGRAEVVPVEALEQWSHGLRAEVARFGVRVTI
jgi:hypothetical protein